MSINWTNWWHGAISAAISLILLVLCYLFIGISFGTIILCLIPGPMGFFFREQAHREMDLKDEYGINGVEIPLYITSEACAFWRWSWDGQCDFYFPVLSSAIIFAIII